MARRADRHPAGAPCPWFVDDRCIDCDAARNVAPGLIARNPGDGVSYFLRQPESAEEIEMAWRAVMVCPTRSVGHETLRRPHEAVFPEDLGDGVYRLGHNSPDSFGAHSYLVVRSQGNVMIDSPRWTREVSEPVADLGGIAHVLLTHRDDVADAERYAEHFGADAWIHADDAVAAPYANKRIEGTSAQQIADGVTAIPVPGHTKGSVLYLVGDGLLFTGDSLSWDPRHQRLMAFRDACWYSWAEQTASLRRLADGPYRFRRIFCGHGWNHDLDSAGFHDHLVALVERMG